jgi:hypothetical protein
MDDAITPDWMKRRKSELSLSDARSAAKTEREKAEALRIRLEWPEFWRQLFLELKVNTDALSSLGARGGTHTLPEDATKEKRIRVNVSHHGAMTHVGLFYIPGHSKIRSLTLDGESVTYWFHVCPDTDRLVVIADDEPEAKTARELAESIVERLLDQV